MANYNIAKIVNTVVYRDLSPARVTKVNEEEKEKRSPGPELENNADPQQENTNVSNGVKEITSRDSIPFNVQY